MSEELGSPPVGAVSGTSPGWIVRADRASLAGMALGLALMLLVPAPWAFRAGFFVVLVSTVAQIAFSHLRGSGA